MGGFDNWFFNTLAGIRIDPESPGFSHFFLEPHPIEGLDWVTCHHDCTHGRIKSSWKIENGECIWNVVVPEGTTATAKVPFSNEIAELPPGEHGFVSARY